jgi:hypothetical protein
VLRTAESCWQVFLSDSCFFPGFVSLVLSTPSHSHSFYHMPCVIRLPPRIFLNVRCGSRFRPLPSSLPSSLFFTISFRISIPRLALFLYSRLYFFDYVYFIIFGFSRFLSFTPSSMVVLRSSFPHILNTSFSHCPVLCRMIFVLYISLC